MKVESIDNIKIINLERKIDIFATEELETVLKNLSIEGNFQICIDMKYVTTICSSALGVMVSAKKRLADSGGDIKLIITDKNLLNFFHDTILDRMFDIFDSRQTCLHAFKQK